MKIVTILKTTTYYPSVGNNEIAPNIKEDVLSEYEATSEISNGVLSLLDSDSNLFSFDEDNNLNISLYLNLSEERIEKELVIKFIK